VICDECVSRNWFSVVGFEDARATITLLSPYYYDRSVGIVRLRTKATEFSFFIIMIYLLYNKLSVKLGETVK
jgi:hypothetical protein